MSIIIRFAEKGDAELVADLSRQTFYDSFASQNTKEDMDKFMNELFTRDALMKEVGKPGNVFLLAYISNEVTGYARMRDGEKISELENKHSIEIARYMIRSSQQVKEQAVP